MQKIDKIIIEISNKFWIVKKTKKNFNFMNKRCLKQPPWLDPTFVLHKWNDS